MRILQVIHQFPPFSSQGSEVYCSQLSQRLRTDDDVRVFHVSNTPARRPRRVDRGALAGVPTYHCVDGGEFARLADWPNAFLREAFDGVLREFSPEVVHFHNFISLGDDLVSRAKSHGAAVVYTLHDYGLICPNCLLRRDDGRLCDKADPDYFEACCPVLIRTSGGRTPRLRPHVPSLARWRMFADQSSRPWLRPALTAAVTAAERWWGLPRHTAVEAKRTFFLTRTRRVFADADLFLAPSEFLRQRYIACGVPADKIAFVRCGLEPFERVTREARGGPVQFGYIGAFHAHKGLEILLKAFEGLDGRAMLHVYGSAFGSPISESYWRRVSEGHAGGVVLHGAYDHGRIGAILASLDAIVVPSLWYENSPLTIQEAFIAGVPVITANQGGMAELVRDGVDGLHFTLGDADDLRARLISIIEQPELLDRLRAHVPRVPTIAEQAAVVRAHYAALRS